MEGYGKVTPPRTKSKTINSHAAELVKMNGNDSGNFHATNPFGNEMETMTRWETLTENLLESTIADMFSELIFNYIPNSVKMQKKTAAAEQPSSSPASPDSTNPVDEAENTTLNNAWPPLEVTDYSLRGWPNSNNKPLCEISTAEEAASRDSDIATPVAAPSTPSIHGNPSGSNTLINSADRNPFLSGYAQQGEPSKALNKPNENLSMPIEDNPLRYVFRTPHQEA